MPLNPRLTDWRGRVVWIVGASSGIGRATASALHARGAQVVVTARNGPALQAFMALHPGSLAIAADACTPGTLRAAARQIVAARGRIDVAMYCAGHYKAMRAMDFDLDEALQHQQVNYVGALFLLDAVLPHLLAQGDGHVSLVSSVAGYRGLPQSLGYGPTKAALINLAQALYLDLHPRGLGVSVINPGFVRTQLTAQNDFAMPALISPETAADKILEGWAAGRFEIHFPKRFTWWMKALRHLGDGLYFTAVRRGTGL
ncbi:SDR family NAD(P)-dependent oxidoreductase [Piscinibacter gummiphilus]|uniref:Short-chain dehydrogenase n=1 Tax=Piscinibacter gummiphilus TaxID=946333 RepID=A0A1W6LG00_9BURK|nr:SDR family NAD(P)-dependent oxidoreductase [Piscinibacter gummiphilus]ARN23185.1 short-chain dehydrogenase [Piscinibacter gummiphilus]ATU67884.1 short-chain dehydrogenase [Piscinibacter gummiphilus]GLS97167.1 oxidoreductase [Piscinibacter gummiphilus]